ncbi:hypothetical protein TUZN_1080 [Thermoproteus uzoniensis 768-20]|uniref:Uncharacterized protein n=1 Tax=Thermoproteus uzoniensis (strain 768-20) TaxID=999630 RepID=F2L078_THEU7|nr:hypothetical protein [Thermoproteus uzoniensis]AEA12560.1 hypothetical protein TUZN_1080 [Thermoproteus uzoniensis 768-20]
MRIAAIAYAAALAASLVGLLRPNKASRLAYLAFLAGLAGGSPLEIASSAAAALALPGDDRRIHAVALLISVALLLPAGPQPYSINGISMAIYTLAVLSATLSAAGLWLGWGLASSAIAVRFVFGLYGGQPWSWSLFDAALAGAWLASLASFHAGSRPPRWPLMAILSAISWTSGGGAGAYVLSAGALASFFYEAAALKPAPSLKGYMAAGAYALSSAGLFATSLFPMAGIYMEGDFFVRVLEPVMAAAVLAGAATVVKASLRGTPYLIPIPLSLAVAAAMYAAGFDPYWASWGVTNIAVPAIAYSALYAAAAAVAKGRRGPWRALHAAAMASVALLAISGPYAYNFNYTKAVPAEPGAVALTYLTWPYPGSASILNVTIHREGGYVETACGPLPRGLVAVAKVDLDGWRADVAVQYGVEQALGRSPAIGTTFVPGPDYIVVLGPAYNGDVSLLGALYWEVAGNSTCRPAAAGAAPDYWYLGFRPVPLATPTAVLLALFAALHVAYLVIYTKLK